MGNKVSEHFENGRISNIVSDADAAQLEWNEHPKFKGVFLKHNVTGDTTGMKVSCHLVRVDPGCQIGEHIHEGKTEIHEIICGSGICHIGCREISYCTGSTAVIPEDSVHSVTAGEDGLFILAKFIPALL